MVNETVTVQPATKIALVTGASRGIGLAIALELARRGIKVIATDINQEFADKATAAFNEHQLSGVGMVLDVISDESIASALNEIKKTQGVAPTILVNNAGITADNLLMRMSDDEWNRVINVNLTSVFRVSKAVIRDMMKARYGRIVNIASIVGVIGNAGQTNYAASKGGILAFTKSLAQEVASRNITVNAIAPGFIETAMTQKLPEEARAKLLSVVPLGRPGTPEDIAKAVAFLVSDDAAYITGHTLHVTGGMA